MEEVSILHTRKMGTAREPAFGGTKKATGELVTHGHMHANYI